MAAPDDPAPALPSSAFLERFQAQAGARGGLRFDEFMALALYNPAVGYYRQARQRVGYSRGTDFFTASTSGPIFGELICAACAQLLEGRDLSRFTFVEIGAEPGGGVLKDVAHPFGQLRTVRVGEPIEITGECVVFSNELFDAQPFRRFVRRGGGWKELGVAAQGTALAEIELPENAADLPKELPAYSPENYTLDLPLASRDLTGAIAGQPWTGLFLALDYGKSWTELVEATPAGTARAYFRHTQSNDLLARPGEQDLTCHICWDWLVDALKERGLSQPTVESQEAFFIHHAGAAIAAISSAEAARFSQRKLSLMQLLHPAHLGQKFQALWATRL